MAKATAFAILVTVNEVFWRPAKNYGRHAALVDNEQRRCEHAVMMKDGWNQTQMVEVVEFDEEGLKDTAKIITEEMERLNQVMNDSEYNVAGNKIKLNAAQRREAFKAIYYPEGKLKLPKYDAVYGFQRGWSLPDAIALQASITGVKVSDVVTDYKLPVHVVTYKHESERIRVCGLENTMKDTGRVSIMKHWPSLFQLAYDFFAAKPSANMAEINELLAGGIVKNNNDGIKIHSLLTLDHRFPELGIKDKILNAGTDKDGKDIGQEFAASLDRTRVWKLVQWLSEEKAQKDCAKGEAYCTGKATTQDDVAVYLADPSADKEVAVVPASKALIHTNMNTTPCMFEKYVEYAIATNRMELLTKLRTPALSIEMLRTLNDLAVKIGIATEKGELIK